jgi:hypothetical protein
MYTEQSRISDRPAGRGSEPGSGSQPGAAAFPRRLPARPATWSRVTSLKPAEGHRRAAVRTGGELEPLEVALQRADRRVSRSAPPAPARPARRSGPASPVSAPRPAPASPRRSSASPAGAAGPARRTRRPTRPGSNGRSSPATRPPGRRTAPDAAGQPARRPAGPLPGGQRRIGCLADQVIRQAEIAAYLGTRCGSRPEMAMMRSVSGSGGPMLTAGIRPGPAGWDLTPAGRGRRPARAGARPSRR